MTVSPADTRHAPATIRRATPRDWERVAALLKILSLPLDGARDHIADFVLAERDGAVVGCAAVERYGDTGLLRSVGIERAEQGHGTGAALVNHALREASAAGVRTVVLLTTTAERYFPRFGFSVIDRASVPEPVRASAEFQGACPASATVMRLDLPAPVVVRAARPNDAPAIAAIYNAGIRGRMATFETRERTPDEVAAKIGDARFPLLVAERDGRVIGWVGASAYRARECYAGIAEFSVYVDFAEQGRRVGDSLMRQFLVALRERGFWKVLSRVFPENAASRALCRRHGFREVGVYEKHAQLDGRWRDVVIVERVL
jgi:phosphinothricin acetyltransferase